MRLKSLRDVVRVENRNLRRVCESHSTHEPDVGVRDWQNARASPRSSRNCADAISSLLGNDRMSRKKRNQMRCDADRAHSWSTATMRNAESLMKVEVAHISPDVARPAKTNHRVHVGAIHV